MKIKTIRPIFVTQFPAVFEQGVLYISEEFETAGHLCCCGCGGKVITSLNPARWNLRKEGGTVSLSPSIGNWNYACKSHYFITKNKVVEAGQFDAKKITAVQRRDRRDMEHYVAVVNARAGQTPEKAPVPTAKKTPEKSLMYEVVAFLKKLWKT
ncbi:MAG: DUF6527 family protein [Thiobacillus sp.]|jgi:hypothetical protein|uniref:DUF6527 family protein n=1 Tax=Thiobacillus sp. TaxID=924 RepID=UPI0028943B6F|nr:DUF6527 family protein [Thiobacillus sp.]MDT3706019.1 DUF6527 family protein [Thiobacillus sp.]